jgi:hypothetical protein
MKLETERIVMSSGEVMDRVGRDRQRKTAIWSWVRTIPVMQAVFEDIFEDFFFQPLSFNERKWSSSCAEF